MDILTEQEGVVIDEIRGHGGFFKGGDTGQRMMAAALDVPVSVPATAGEGGAWGMAVLAAYLLRADTEQARCPTTSTSGSPRASASRSCPIRATSKGSRRSIRRHAKGLAIEREAVKALS